MLFPMSICQRMPDAKNKPWQMPSVSITVWGMTGLCNVRRETAAEIKYKYCSVVECTRSIVDIFVADEKSKLVITPEVCPLCACLCVGLFLCIKGSGLNPDVRSLFLLGCYSGKTFIDTNWKAA